MVKLYLINIMGVAIMSKTIVAALIGAGATIAAGIFGVIAGKSAEQKIIQNEINEAFDDVINVIGDDNNITINDIKGLIEDYQNIQIQNKSLLDQNTKYFDDLTEANNKLKDLENDTNQKLDELQKQIDSMPSFEYTNLGLCIDVEDISINKNNSMVTIDGREYFSKEIAENLISDDKNITIKDDTLFVGKVVADKANLLDQYENEYYKVFSFSNEIDSYGNNRSNGLYFNLENSYSDSYIRYSLKQKYAYLDFWVSVPENTKSNYSGKIVITINNKDTIYTSDSINLLTKPFKVEGLKINNCDLLEIWLSNDNGQLRCLITDAVIYN